MSDRIPDWSNRKNFSRRAHQDIVDEVNYQGNLTGVGDIIVHKGVWGTSISDAYEELKHLNALAVIIPPEDSEHTYGTGDPRYRCRIVSVVTGTVPESLMGMAFEDDRSEQREGATTPTGSSGGPDIGWTVTATNIAEVTDYATGAGTHYLPEDNTMVVRLTAVYDKIPGPNKVDHVRWFFESFRLPKAQYQGMVLQDVVDGQWGADYVPGVEDLT